MSTDDPDDLKDEFWERVADFEDQEPRCLFDMLPQSGVSLPPPDSLDDAQVTAKLWEVINGIALLGVFLHNTNHLSDRELYVYLWSEVLREEIVLMPEIAAYACHFDLVGSGNEEDTRLYMKYYAGEEDRRRWLEEWPSYRLPEHEDPPYDRDRRLPQAEARTDGPIM